MDRIAKNIPAADLFAQAATKAQPRKQTAEGEFKSLLESAVNSKQEQHPKTTVERPETASPEKQAARKQRNQESAGATGEPPQEPVLADEAQEPVLNETAAAAEAAQAMALFTAVPQATEAVAATAQTAIPAPMETEVADSTASSGIIMAEAADTPEQPAAPQAEAAPTDPAQQKFDTMLQKAAQELESAKPQPDVSAVAEDAPEQAEAPAPEAEQPVSVKEEAPPAQSESPVHANVQQAARAPVMEQKPLTAIPEEDRATLGLVQAASTPPPAPEAPPEPARMRQPEPVPQPVPMPDQTERIRAEVVKNLDQQRTEFTMRLEPETLGKIDVRMILEGGKLAVEITAATQKTAELLQRQTEQLATSLRIGNVSLGSIQVTSAQEASSHMEGQFGLESGHNRQTQHEGSGSGQRRGETQPEGERQPEAPMPNQLLDYAI